MKHMIEITTVKGDNKEQAIAGAISRLLNQEKAIANDVRLSTSIKNINVRLVPLKQNGIELDSYCAYASGKVSITLTS